jgi:hypothetical protein
LTQAIEHLRQAQLTALDSIANRLNTQAYTPLQKLIMIDEETRQSIYQDHILDSLKFDEMHQRFDAVHGAHEDTFKWIYEPIQITDEDEDMSYEKYVRQEAALKVLVVISYQRTELMVMRSTDATRIKREIIRLAFIRRVIITNLPYLWKVGIWKININEVSMLSSDDRGRAN